MDVGGCQSPYTRRHAWKHIHKRGLIQGEKENALVFNSSGARSPTEKGRAGGGAEPEPVPVGQRHFLTARPLATEQGQEGSAGWQRLASLHGREEARCDLARAVGSPTPRGHHGPAILNLESQEAG